MENWKLNVVIILFLRQEIILADDGEELVQCGEVLRGAQLAGVEEDEGGDDLHPSLVDLRAGRVLCRHQDLVELLYDAALLLCGE